MRVLLVSGNRERQPQSVLPLGLACVAGALRPAHEVVLCDLCWEEEPDAALLDAVESFHPDVVGLAIRNLNSNAYTGRAGIIDGHEATVRLLRAATSAPLVLGGAGFSLQPRALAERLRPEFGVIGEGEIALPWLLDRLAAGERPSPFVRAGADGAPAAARLDDLPPPARDLYDPRHLERNGGTDSVQTKRGCAFSCNYCDYPDLEGRFARLRDPAAVADEFVERAAAPGVRCIFVVDSVFNVPPRHAEAVCEALVERGSSIPWLCYATPAGLSDRLVAAMAEAGCVGIEVGADSGTEEGLRRLGKPFRLRDVEEAHLRCASHGIRDCHTYVLGGFGESLDDVRRTLDHADRVDADVAVFMVFEEQREDVGPAVARHRREILELVGREAASHPGWSVPELAIRTGDEVRVPGRGRVPLGPPWLSLARLRRVAPWLAATTAPSAGA